MFIMLDARTQAILSRLPRNAPWLASLALGALLSVELARITAMLIGASPVKPVQPAAAPAPTRPLRQPIDAQSIANAHLFGAFTADPSSQDPSSAPLSSANLVLAGTIATQDPKHGVAIISDGGPSKVYSVGDNVSGAALFSVYLDHVVLNRAGTLETLVLPRQLPPARPTVAAQPAPPLNRPAAASVENLRRMVQQDPGILTQIMRAVPSYDNGAGKLRGFRIYPGRNRAAFNGLGLRPGDLVTAINGTALDDPQRGQDIMNTIESSDRATVTIERGGTTQDVSLNIAQVAAEASRDLSVPGAAPAPGAAAPVGNPLAPQSPLGFGPRGMPGPGGRQSMPPLTPPTPPPMPTPD